MTTNDRIIIEPDDTANRILVDHTHPPEWANPRPADRYNLLVIGGGPAGLVAAVGAASLGAKVALVEKHLLGGDCLIYGCVPSKALIRCAKAAHEVRDASRFGVNLPGEPTIDFAAVMQHVRQARSDIAHHDAASRFRDLGVDVFLGEGRFTSRNEFEISGTTIRFRKAVVATGARAAELPIPGIEEAGALTNESVFSLTEQPKRMAVIGAGPIGCELAQSFQRLGTQVTLIEMAPQILIREDPDAAKIVADSLEADGVQFELSASLKRIELHEGAKRLILADGDSEHSIDVDAVLLGVGRKPNVENLGLEAAGVKYDEKGIEVDDYLRTSSPNIFAAGDVCMEYKFTHTADAAAAIVLRNALFGFLPRYSKLSALTVPWATYTDPEIAHVGLNARMAEERGIRIDTYTASMSDLDRAIADGETDGLLKVHVDEGSDSIVGATLVARNAGDMISEITTAMMAKKGLNHFNSVIHPYPTRSEIIRKASGAYRRTLLSPLASRVMAFIMQLQR